jgi:L-aspartate oxidase
MEWDFLVVGAGVAGLRAAIELATAGRVLVIVKDSLRESSTEYAQGGIAAALSEDDDVALHERDTLGAGDELCDPAAVHQLVERGTTEVGRLIEWGAQFDHEGARLAFGREGAHSRRRIVHAQGDSTGHEIARALYYKAASLPQIEFRSFTAVTDLLATDRGEVAGVMVFDASAGSWRPLRARATLLATGGLGRLFRYTTNPEVATGDGVAAAWRAGAEISDIEFVQYHPTALRLPGAPPFLLSEAMRGEGGRLRNAGGDLFMVRYDPREELAPRDVVSRAIISEVERTADSCVYLDMRGFGAEFLHTRFPRIFETCLRYGLNLARDMAPVHPAAHYAMGGVRTDLFGRTNLPRLFAAGEAACTGVHGANRLASNSLLEGMVYGATAGAAMREWAGAPALDPLDPEEPTFPSLDAEELRTLAWDRCGVVRHGPALEEAVDRLANVPRRPAASPDRAMFELRGMHAVLELIARCALAREESRGAHYRADFPARRAEFQKHSLALKGQNVRFV